MVVFLCIRMWSGGRVHPTNCSYYNGVNVSRTTTSSGSRCHAYTPSVLLLVLVLLAASAFAGSTGVGDDEEDSDQQSPVSIFPVQAAWTTDLGHAPAAAPAYDDTHAYVPLRNGTLAAVRLSDGETAWIVDQPTAFPPLPGDAHVIVAAEASLVAHRITDGQPLWVLDFGRPISATPLREGGWLVVPLSDGVLVTLRAADGAEYWRRTFEGGLHAKPALAGDLIFVPVDSGQLVALDLVTGKPVWERMLGGRPGEVLPLESLFVGSTNNHMYRLSLDKGTVEWRWRTGGDIIGLPVVDENWLYFASLDNLLYALDRESGVQQWRRALEGRPRAGPTLIGDVLFVSGVSDQLPTFDRKTGHPANTLSAPGELGAAPHIAPALAAQGLQMVLLVADGHLIGMRSASGPPTFSLDFPPPPLLPGPELLEPADVLPFEPLIPIFSVPEPPSATVENGSPGP